MSFEPVDIYTKDSAGYPISGVLVKVYDSTGTIFQAQGTTGIDGKVSFLLDTLEYQTRYYRFQTGFSQPVSIAVESGTNIFDIVGEPFVPPVSPDSRFCRCSGYFRDGNGLPKKFLDMTILADFDPALLDDAAVITDNINVSTDKDGYAQVDLIRGGDYWVNIESVNDIRRLRHVPDAASCNLPDLLFPRVNNITFEPAGPYEVHVGDVLTLTPTVYDSVGRPLVGTAGGDVAWTVNDKGSLGVGVTDLAITAAAIGTITLTATRKDSTIIKIPDVPIEGVPVEIVVS
jgi:hypothetical protein